MIVRGLLTFPVFHFLSALRAKLWRCMRMFLSVLRRAVRDAAMSIATGTPTGGKWAPEHASVRVAWSLCLPSGFCWLRPSSHGSFSFLLLLSEWVRFCLISSSTPCLFGFFQVCFGPISRFRHVNCYYDEMWRYDVMSDPYLSYDASCHAFHLNFNLWVGVQR